MGIRTGNSRGLEDLQRQIQPGPTCDYIYVVILNVLLSMYRFLINVPLLMLTLKKTSQFHAETFCLVSHQNTRLLKLING